MGKFKYHLLCGRENGKKASEIYEQIVTFMKRDLQKKENCDIITMGHHGSDTSVYLSFLDAVNADVAIVSCGRNNIYGHPHKKALEYINDNDMILYRTDYDGHIVLKYLQLCEI